LIRLVEEISELIATEKEFQAAIVGAKVKIPRISKTYSASSKEGIEKLKQLGILEVETKNGTINNNTKTKG